MSHLVDGRSDLRHPARDAGRRLVVDDHHRRDAVCRVGGEPFGHHPRVDASPPVSGDEVDRQPEALRHVAPQGGEMAGFEGQHLIAGRQGVDECRLPRPGTRGGVDDHRTGGAEHRLDPLQEIQREVREARSAVVDGGLRDGPENPVGDVGRSRNLQEVASTVNGHETPFVP